MEIDNAEGTRDQAPIVQSKVVQGSDGLDPVSIQTPSESEPSAMETEAPSSSENDPSTKKQESSEFQNEDKETSSKSTVKNFILSNSKLFPYDAAEDFSQIFKTADTINAEKVEKMDDDSEVAPSSGSLSSSDKDKINPQVVESPFVAAAIKESQKTLTENMASTFSTSDDARLDFFFGAMEQTNDSVILNLIKESWEKSPLDTLKLLANLRDIKGGKGIRPQYQKCLYWMYENHPRTLYENLGEFVKFGYWKDVLHLLVIVLFDGYIHPYFKQDANPTVKKKSEKKNRKRPHPSADDSARKNADLEKRIYNQRILNYYGIKAEASEVSKHESHAFRLKYSREKFQKDVKYRVFHTKIAELFATQLIKDLGELNSPKKAGSKDISLCAKWAPTLEGHFDRYTLIGTTIALEIMKKINQHHELMSKSLPVGVYLARKTYNKQYCIPLRRFIEIPEQYMSKNQWSTLKYEHVPAKCMKRNKAHFIKHDKERFETYVNSKDSKVAGASLKPVELICEAMSLDGKDPIEQTVLEKQWESLAESIKKDGKCLLKSAVAVCDVSGSMAGVPMKAAIGLTLLTMHMTESPWSNICITFSESPQLFNLDPSLKLIEKLRAMESMPWGMNTDLNKVFELIVSLGKKSNLTDDKMPKLLFIYTDMEFDCACDGSNQQTNFEAAKTLFQENGYTMPSVIFWNLRDSYHGGVGGRMMSTSTPVQKNELGVCMLSGFSGQLLKYVMNGDDISQMTPLKFLTDVIANERYNKLIVVD